MSRSILLEVKAIQKCRAKICSTKEGMALQSELDVTTIRDAERGTGIAISSLVQISHALKLPSRELPSRELNVEQQVQYDMLGFAKPMQLPRPSDIT